MHSLPIPEELQNSPYLHIFISSWQPELQLFGEGRGGRTCAFRFYPSVFASENHLKSLCPQTVPLWKSQSNTVSCTDRAWQSKLTCLPKQELITGK